MTEHKSKRWHGQVYTIEEIDNNLFQAVVPRQIAEESALFSTTQAAWGYVGSLIQKWEETK